MREARPLFQYLFKKLYEGGSPPCMCMKQIEQERAGCGGNKRRGMGGRGARGRGGSPTPTPPPHACTLGRAFKVSSSKLYDYTTNIYYDYTTILRLRSLRIRLLRLRLPLPQRRLSVVKRDALLLEYFECGP